MKRRTLHGQRPLPELPLNTAAYSGRYTVGSKNSWGRFAGRVAVDDQAFQMLLLADDEISAAQRAKKFVERHVVPYLRGATKCQQVRLHCESDVAMPLGNSGYYSVTFIAAMKRNQCRTK